MSVGRGNVLRLTYTEEVQGTLAMEPFSSAMPSPAIVSVHAALAVVNARISKAVLLTIGCAAVYEPREAVPLSLQKP
jgi:hypothetical protein